MAISDEWWNAWWRADYSWEGLAQKPWQGWYVDKAWVEGEPFVPVPKDERVGGVDYRRATLQDYWRRGMQDAKLTSDQFLVRVENEEWTGKPFLEKHEGRTHFSLMHLPPQWRDGTATAKIDHAKVPAGLKEVLKAELGREIKDTVFEDGWRLKGADHRLQWQGVVMPKFSLSDLSPQTQDKNDRIPVTIMAGQAAFFDHANFMSAAFSSNANFRSAAFSRDANFSGAAFSRDANFSGAAFSGDANFSRAAFSSNADFRSAAFSRNATFMSAAFSGDANFSSATFQSDAIFSGQANSLLSDPVEAEIQFSSPETGVGMSGTYKQPEQSGWRAQRSFPRAYFQAATFFGRALFDNRDFHSATVEEEDDGAERNTFDGVTFHKDAVFHGSELHRGIPFTDTDFDQALKAKSEDSRYFERLEDAFRTLKQIMEDRRNRMEEARFFRLELLARRGRHKRWWAKLPSYIYEGLSNFGTSVRRPLVWLAFFMLILFPALYLLMGAGFTHWPTLGEFGDAMAYSFGRVLPFGPWEDPKGCTMTARMLAEVVQPDCPDVRGLTDLHYRGGTPFWLRFWGSVQSLFAIILVFLSGLAIRRRFQIN